jgi:hypothetical protein
MRSDSEVTEKGSEGVPEHPKVRLSEEQVALGRSGSAEEAFVGLSAKARGKLPARWNSKLPDRLVQSLEEEDQAGAGSTMEPETQQGRDTGYVKRWLRHNRASMMLERARPGHVESGQRVEPEQRVERGECRAAVDVAEERHEDASARPSEGRMHRLGPAERHTEPVQHTESKDVPPELMEGLERAELENIPAEQSTEPAQHDTESEDVPPELLKGPECPESEHTPTERYTEPPPQTGRRGQLECMESIMPMAPKPEGDEDPEQPPETQDNQAQVDCTATEPEHPNHPRWPLGPIGPCPDITWEEFHAWQKKQLEEGLQPEEDQAAPAQAAEQPGEDSPGGSSIDAKMAVKLDMLLEQRMTEYYADLDQGSACKESERPGGDMTPGDF